MAAGAEARPESGRGGVKLNDLASVLLPGRLLWLVVLVGGLLRLYRYDALSLWVDEGLTVGFGRLPWDTVLGLRGAYETHPPLYFALAKMAGLFAPELIAGRLVSVVAGTLTLPIIYALGARLMWQWGGLVATIVVALSPLHIWYSQEARPYALTLLLVCVAYLALASFHASRDSRWAWLYGVAVAAALYANYSAIYALVPQGILLVYLAAAHGRRALVLWIAGAAGVLAFLPWVPQMLNTVQTRGEAVGNYLGVSAEKVSYSVLSVLGVGGQGSYFWGAELTAWERWPGWQWAMAAAMLAVVSIGTVALARRGLFSLLVAACLLVGTIVVCALVSLASPGYAERTIIYSVAGWALVAGAAVTHDARRWRWAGSVALAAVSLLALASLWAIYGGGDKQHWRELARDAAQVTQRGEMVILYPPVTSVLLDAYQPGRFEGAAVIADFAELPESVRPEAGVDALWIAYVETGGLERLQAQLGERGYRRVEHHYYWNPMWLDRYEAGADDNR